MNALVENSVNDWAPHTRLRFYHNMDDKIIPYSDSENTVALMKTNGSKNVELITLNNDIHLNSAFDFIERVIIWFSGISEE